MSAVRRSDFIQLFVMLGLATQWIVLRAHDINLPDPWGALLPGLAVFGAAYVLSWAAELAQLEIPRALAIAFVALVAVLPEYAVDMYFAWTAGKNPSYVAYAAANMTGGNRLLIGAGWATVIFAYYLKTRRASIMLDAGYRRELVALGLATAYSFIIPLKQTLSLLDAAVLLSLFAAYMTSVSRAPVEDVEIEEGGPVAWLSKRPRARRRLITVGFFLLAGCTIFMAAQPFAEGLLAAGRHWGIEEFLLVQWLAPLASEAPEFIVATLFALRNNPGAGMGALISSKVNQWTLLVGMLPLVYALSAHSLHGMALDARQVEEMFLTSAQSVFAIVVLSDLEFSLIDGAWLAALFAAQFLFIHPTARLVSGVIYLLLAAGLLIRKSSAREGCAQLLKETRQLLFFGR